MDKKTITLKRSTVGALIIRMDIGDIPYFQSSKGRAELIKYLYSIFSDTTTREYNRLIHISISDIKNKLSTSDEALEILKYYEA